MRCLKCLDSGWVCEDHKDRPWGPLTDGGCECGAEGAPCSCNPEGVVEWKEIFAEAVPEGKMNRPLQ